MFETIQILCSPAIDEVNPLTSIPKLIPNQLIIPVFSIVSVFLNLVAEIKLKHLYTEECIMYARLKRKGMRQ